MNENSAAGVLVALGPLRWNLAKVERQWDKKIEALKEEAADKQRETECKHRQQRKALAQHLKSLRDAAKSNIPLSGRLATMKASRENLIRLGRAEEAEKVGRKLVPLEKCFWAKKLAGTGYPEAAKRKKDSLMAAQQAELGSLALQLRRDVERAQHTKHAEVKTEQRKNRCSSDDVWSIWSAAKSGEADRLSYMLSLPRANVDVRDPDSAWTALHFASRQGKLATVKVLIEHQAFVGSRAPDGRTPLHLAAGWGTYEVCFALLEAGADKTVRDSGGETSQHLAESRQRTRVVALLDGWRPIGLTATQTRSIIEAREQGPLRPWEAETDPAIRSQLRALDMKRETFGNGHRGIRLTLGRLGGLCRAAGRLEDAKDHLQNLLELLQYPPRSDEGGRGSSAKRGSHSEATPRGDGAALTVALGNLGVVCRELGDGERASELFEAALETASSIEDNDTSGDTSRKCLMAAATRNLGLHYLSEGRVKEAQPLLRTCLREYEETLRSDMEGGDESLELIPPLEVLSYADMLAGDHDAAAENAARAQAIAAKHRAHGGVVEDLLPVAEVNRAEKLSDPVPRLEWLGVQRFVARDDSSAVDFFVRARALLLLRLRDQACSKLGGDSAAAKKSGSGAGVSRRGTDKECGLVPTRVSPPRGKTAAVAPSKGSRGERLGGALPAEFHPDAMRLDRCMAVATCQQGPGAF